MAKQRAVGSTVPRRQLGRHIRAARQNARMTIEGAARALDWSAAKMSRIEHGAAPVRRFDVVAMCTVFGVGEADTEIYVGMAEETRSTGWWHTYGNAIPEGFNLYVGLEDAARELYVYQPELVPGLLQTEEYARAVIRAAGPDRTDDEVEQRVRLRMQRQTLITRGVVPTRLSVLLNEAVLHRPVGGAQAMSHQLRRLAELSERPNVEVRVVPFTVGLHYGVVSGPFVLLHFPVNGEGTEIEPPVVYVEGMTGELYLDRPSEVARYDSMFERTLALVDDETGYKSRDRLWKATMEVGR